MKTRKKKLTSMSGRLSSREPLLHINTHQHLKKNTANSADVALTRV